MVESVKWYRKDLINENVTSYVLGIDVGGTQTNCAVAALSQSRPILMFSMEFKSQALDGIVPAIQQILEYGEEHNISIKTACIGAAGIVVSSDEPVHLTNLEWMVDPTVVKNKTPLTSVHVINDFQALGFGINLLDKTNPQDIFTIRSGFQSDQSKHPAALIGAGTGLGKALLQYHEEIGGYIPCPSEGGHADFPIYNDDEQKLVSYLKKIRGITHPLPYEEVLSGRGIEGIYLFLKNHQDYGPTEVTRMIGESDNKAAVISSYRKTDPLCEKTFEWFTRFYGRCAKNIVLDSLASGGLYIAGGIAEKNKEIFQTDVFLEEFGNAYRRRDFLSSVPIYVITNYEVSLFGACFAAMMTDQNRL